MKREKYNPIFLNKFQKDMNLHLRDKQILQRTVHIILTLL